MFYVNSTFHYVGMRLSCNFVKVYIIESGKSRFMDTLLIPVLKMVSYSLFSYSAC